MNLIKLDAIDSTSSFLRRLSQEGELDDYTVAVAEEQTEGRGQMGTTWTSEKGKNLTFSVFKMVSCLDKSDQFYLSMAVSLAVFRALQSFNLPQLKIKWPNDILSDNKKICGILIENVIRHGGLDAAIIGIGLNVNQVIFDESFKAASLKSLTGQTYNKLEILYGIIEKLKYYQEMVSRKRWEELREEYELNLFRINKPSTFEDRNGNYFMGFIKGVTRSGELKVLLEDEIIKQFELKEIKLLY